MVLTLVSAVAGTYVDIPALDKQLEITRRTPETRRETRDLFQMRLDNGVVPEIDLSQAEAEYQDAPARIPEIELAIALVERAKSDQRLQSLGRQVAALENYARLARMRHDEGATSFLEALDAGRSLFNVELSQTAGQNTLFRSLINIYKAMGGGWIEAAEAAATPQPVMKAGFIP